MFASVECTIHYTYLDTIQCIFHIHIDSIFNYNMSHKNEWCWRIDSGSDTSPFSESPTIGRPKLKLFLKDEPDTLSDVHDFNKDTTKIPSPFAYSKRTSATRTCVSQINQNRTSPVIAGKKSTIT